MRITALGIGAIPSAWFRLVQRTAMTGQNSIATPTIGPNFRAHSLRSGVITTVGQAVRLGIQLLAGVIVARLLSPPDYGLLGMVAAVTGFLSLFGDLGLSFAVIQNRHVTHAQVSALFWVNTCLGVSLTLLALILAPVIAWTYREPRLTAIMAVLSVGFIMGALGSQHQALLRREMRFATIAGIDIVAIACGSTTGLLLALQGKGYWSLVYTQLATSLTALTMYWLTSKWRPGKPAPIREIKALLAFGGNLTAFSFVNYFSRNLDNALIGWRWGATALGNYARAYQLILFPIWQITAPIASVAIPALSRLQDNPARHRNYYLKSIRAIAYVTMPLILLGAVLADELIPILLGHQWLECAKVFRILALAAVFQPVLTTVGWLYVSLGRARAMAKWGLFSFALTVPSFVIGLPWGIQGVATCYAIATWLLIYPEIHFATKSSAIRPRHVFGAVLPPFGLALICALTVIVLRALLPQLPPERFLSAAAVDVLVTMALLYWFVIPIRKDIREVLDEIRSSFGPTTALSSAA